MSVIYHVTFQRSRTLTGHNLTFCKSVHIVVVSIENCKIKLPFNKEQEKKSKFDCNNRNLAEFDVSVK